MLRKKEQKIKTVTWYDAIQKNIDIEYLKSLTSQSEGKELLAINKTYGIVKELKDVVLVIHEDSTDETTDVTIIPKGWIIKIE